MVIGGIMKKGLIDQPFIYIFAIVVIAFILIFGIRSIMSLINLEKEVEGNVFFSSLNNQIDHYYNLATNSYGTKEITVPLDVKYVCFIKKNEGNIPQGPATNFIPLMINPSENKVFLIPGKTDKKEFSEELTRKSVKFYDETGAESSFCSLVNGKLKIKVKNEGMNVGIYKI